MAFFCICPGLEATLAVVDDVDDAVAFIQQGVDYVNLRISDLHDPLDDLDDDDHKYWKETAMRLIEENRELLDKVRLLKQKLPEENNVSKTKWLATQVLNLQRELNTTQSSLQDMRQELNRSRADRDKLRISAFEVVEENQKLIQKHDADAVAEKQWFQLQQDMSNEIDELEESKRVLQQRYSECITTLNPFARWKYGSSVVVRDPELPRSQQVPLSRRATINAQSFS